MNRFFDEGTFPQETLDNLAAGRKAMLLKLWEMSEAEGMLLFEGRWLTPDEVVQHYRLLKKTHRWLLVELMGIFIAVLFITIIVSLLLTLLGAIG